MSGKAFILVLCTFLPSFLRLAVWRLLGFRVGRGCRVAPFSVVVADHIELGHGAVINMLTLIVHPSRLYLGERCRIASFVRIIGTGEIMIAAQAFVGLGCLIESSPGYRFSLGARSALGPRGIYYTHGGNGLLFNMGYPQKFGNIQIGEDCWLGMACVVYPGVSIGPRTVILPGLVVGSSVAGDQAIFPPVNTFRALPVRFLQPPPGHLRNQQVEVMKYHFDRLTTLHRGSTVLKDAGHWILQTAEGNTLILQLGNDGMNVKNPLRTVVWRLEGERDGSGVPVFTFTRLEIDGRWTPFAERIASYLCEHAGSSFVFLSRMESPALS